MTMGTHLYLSIQGIRLCIAMKRHAQGKRNWGYNVGLRFLTGRCRDRDLSSVFTFTHGNVGIVRKSKALGCVVLFYLQLILRIVDRHSLRTICISVLSTLRPPMKLK